MASSPDLSGGKGFTFEDVAVAEYLLALLAKETAPGLSGYVVTRVEQQRAAFGQPLDDLIVDAVSQTADEMRLSLQAKSSLTVSAAKTNADFHDTITKCWETISKPGFRKDRDRVGVVVRSMSDESRRALADVAEWARDSTDGQSFMARFAATGFAGGDKKNVIRAMQDILPGAPDNDIHTLLRHFVVIRLDALHEGATDDAAAITLARRTLEPSASGDAQNLWTAIKQIARDGAGVAAQISRGSLLTKLSGRFQFSPAPALKAAVARITDEAKLSLADISNQIDGVSIDRPKLKSKFDDALGKHTFVQIVGMPGTGKSGTLLTLAQAYLPKGSLLALKSDRIASTGWHAYAQSIGLPPVSAEDLLVEVGATGTPILFVDGLDRFMPGNKGVVLDLINTILKSPSLKHWKIVATLRDNGIEPVRTWLPAALFKEGGVGTVEVEPFDDDEATVLAAAQPVLQPLLFGSERVREIARRPFFASVLLRSMSASGGALSPKSEVELVEAWWSRGGYDAGSGEEMRRQRTLLSLASKAGYSLGGSVSVEDLDASAIQAFISDGIIRKAKSGHSVQFAHDIFFEWAFFHLLVDRGNTWSELIVSMGELPGLARPVELLSQSEFVSTDTWENTLRQLEASKLRAQWQRAWLLAPFSTPVFFDREGVFNAAVLTEDTKRLSRTIVWYQAEKTRPNPQILAAANAGNEEGRRDTLRTADVLAWPSDISSWRRFCSWLLRVAPKLPIKIIPDAVTALSVWQNIGFNTPNAVSRAIFRQLLSWLEDLEDQVHSREFKWNPEGWNQLSRADLTELENALRSEILRSAVVEREAVGKYLKRLASNRWIRDSAFETVAAFTGMLAATLPEDIAELARAEFLNDLPEAVMNRPSEGMHIPHMMGHHDWQTLAVHDRNGFFPVSPLREPFYSLLRAATPQALDLIRCISNHAITAWRQLHRYDYQRRGTPLPLVIEFPWGKQEFYGDSQTYCWSRGHWGPHPLECAMMALDAWAFEQLEAGADVDQLIQTIVTGHQSVAVLAIAVAIAIAASHASPTVVALAGAQRLWGYDYARSRQDGPSQANLIGFMSARDPHWAAVKKGNERRARTVDIRWLAQISMLSPDSSVRDAIQKAVRAFPENLPFEYQEQLGFPDYAAALRKQADAWAVIGEPKNYHAEEHPSGEGLIIMVKNPKESDPEAVEARERANRLIGQLTLANWAERWARDRELSDSISTEAAIASARALDKKGLFSGIRVGSDDAALDRGAVAGVAATALESASMLSAADSKWAAGVLLRAATTPEPPIDYGFSEQIPLYHPVGYAVRGLGAMVRKGIEAGRAKDALLELSAHPLEEVAACALSEAIGCFSVDQNFAWSALNLAVLKSIGEHKDAKMSAYGYDFTQPPKVTQRLISTAKRQAKSRRPIAVLETIPPIWETIKKLPANPRMIRRVYTDAKTGALWREPDRFLRWDFLSRVLADFAVDQFMADELRRPVFLSFAYALLRWTILRLVPPWERSRDDRDQPEREPYVWQRTVMRFLADVALNQSVEETENNILKPIFALHDKPAATLLEPFANMIVCKGVLDPKCVSPQAIPILTRCVQRIIKARDWEGARHSDGDIYGHHLSPMTKDLLMLPVDQANLASRFANGDWREIAIAMPVIDPFVRAAGDVPTVTLFFLKLCERAKGHYPAETFVSQVEAFLAHQAGTPAGWRGSMITGRIAVLIQEFAEAAHPLPQELGQGMLRILDRLVDMGDRRSAALQSSEMFRSVKT